MAEPEMSYMEQLDIENQRFAHKMEVQRQEDATKIAIAKANRSSHRKEMVGYLAIAFAVVGVVFTISYFIYHGTRPSPYTDEETKREQACVSNGGGFVPKDLLKDGTNHGLCVFPGRQP